VEEVKENNICMWRAEERKVLNILCIPFYSRGKEGAGFREGINNLGINRCPREEGRVPGGIRARK
jgi:hypothetical protein